MFMLFSFLILPLEKVMSKLKVSSWILTRHFNYVGKYLSKIIFKYFIYYTVLVNYTFSFHYNTYVLYNGWEKQFKVFLKNLFR